MLSQRIQSKLKNLRTLKNCLKSKSTKVVFQEQPFMPSQREAFQFSKDRLVEFGELPIGEVPLELKSQPENIFTRLSNDAQIVTEHYNGALSQVSVFINAGSRWETLESSGTARLLTNLFLRGTNSKSR